MLKEQVAVPDELEAVQATKFVPTGKAVPDGGLQVTVSGGVPVAVGEKKTTAEH